MAWFLRGAAGAAAVCTLEAPHLGAGVGILDPPAVVDTVGVHLAEARDAHRRRGAQREPGAALGVVAEREQGGRGTGGEAFADRAGHAVAASGAVTGDPHRQLGHDVLQPVEVESLLELAEQLVDVDAAAVPAPAHAGERREVDLVLAGGQAHRGLEAGETVARPRQLGVGDVPDDLPVRGAEHPHPRRRPGAADVGGHALDADLLLPVESEHARRQRAELGLLDRGQLGRAGQRCCQGSGDGYRAKSDSHRSLRYHSIVKYERSRLEVPSARCFTPVPGTDCVY